MKSLIILLLIFIIKTTTATPTTTTTQTITIQINSTTRINISQQTPCDFQSVSKLDAKYDEVMIQIKYQLVAPVQLFAHSDSFSILQPGQGTILFRGSSLVHPFGFRFTCVTSSINTG